MNAADIAPALIGSGFRGGGEPCSPAASRFRTRRRSGRCSISAQFMSLRASSACCWPWQPLVREYTRGRHFAGFPAQRHASGRTAGVFPDDARLISRAGGSRSTAWCASRSRSRSPTSRRCRRAPRSRSTIATKAGRRSASGPACRSRMCCKRPRLLPQARYVVFRCLDELVRTPDGSGFYYESLDLFDALHPQTILAYGMNGRALPVEHGAPLRLRVERQIGYKHAKYVTRIEAVDRLGGIGRGKGGFWEDRGYQWYAGQ